VNRYKLGSSKDSMRETFPHNARFLVIPRRNDSSYGKGDVVVFQDLSDGSINLVKRIIGTPDEDIVVDGKEYFLGTDEYFVIGESHGHVSGYIPYDSRYFGPISVNYIIGRAWFMYWPLGRIGRVS
tara:strand:+ start:114 stop:491 length:378 start_codon:yes stop_codon:yes gene_type:complete